MQFTYTASQPGTHQKRQIMNGVDVGQRPKYGVGLNTILRHLKLWPQVGGNLLQLGTASAREMTNSVKYVGLNRYGFAAYDRPEDGCCARIPGERTMA
ncbi:hypothetical protein F4W66_08280 [Escherichia coli]|nr:hypothetical protein F4W66_08280 [Escherichia coli]